jgi:hypothetical protein
LIWVNFSWIVIFFFFCKYILVFFFECAFIYFFGQPTVVVIIIFFSLQVVAMAIILPCELVECSTFELRLSYIYIYIYWKC